MCPGGDIEAANRKVIAEWISQSSLPLTESTPTSTLDDITPLWDRLSDARVIGLGEATHGTREFFQLKHRLIRFLVEQLGVRVIGWEANFAATLPLNDYVQDDRGDPADLLSNESIHWPFRSEAVVTFLKWSRTFNDGRAPGDQVKLYGFDMQYPAEAARHLRSFLADTDHTLLSKVKADLEPLATSGAVDVVRS